MPNPNYTVYQETEQSVLETREYGYKYCRICGRWADGGHLACPEHEQRVKEQAAANAMAGPCCSMRRFEKTPGLLEACSRDGIRR